MVYALPANSTHTIPRRARKEGIFIHFDEDRSQVRTNSAPRVMATLRNLAISLLRLAHQPNIAKALRYYAAKPHLTLGVIGL